MVERNLILPFYLSLFSISLFIKYQIIKSININLIKTGVKVDEGAMGDDVAPLWTQVREIID